MGNLVYSASLHNHTDYSNFRLRDSINRVEELIDYAIELGHKGIAFTEHETISNAIHIERYWDKIKEQHPDFKIIRGNEIYLCRNGLTAENFDKENDKYWHFILLAKDAIGHEQIREISTRAWMRAYTARGMRRVPTYYTDLFEVIGSNPGHVIGSTACLGGLLGDQLLRWRASGFLEQSRYERIQNWLIGLQELFGRDNFYLEMQPSNNLEQVFVNQEIIKLANKLDIPFIITDDAHYLKKEDLKFERIFLNAQGGEREVDSFYATTYLKSDSEVRDFMIPQIGEDNLQRAYQSIDKILDSCEWFSLRKPLKIPCLDWRTFNSTDIESWYGRIPMLKKFWTSPHKEDRELARAVVDSITLHEDLANEEAFNELNLCLEDTWVSSEVNNARWSAYFLNLQKIIDRCWEAGTIVGPGRGSGVGFLLLYALDIIQINSLREQTKTYRFRFLNPDRVSVLD